MVCMLRPNATTPTTVKDITAIVPRPFPRPNQGTKKITWTSEREFTNALMNNIPTNDVIFGNILEIEKEFRSPVCQIMPAHNVHDTAFYQKYQCNAIPSVDRRFQTWLKTGCPYHVVDVTPIAHRIRSKIPSITPDVVNIGLPANDIWITKTVPYICQDRKKPEQCLILRDEFKQIIEPKLM